MVRYKRIYYLDAVYHVISRGNNRQKILQYQEDKESLMESISRYKDRYMFKLYAFVFMDNHFHMILNAGAVHDISRIMQGILLSYSNKFRHRYGYVGHVWQGRFISRVIQSEQQIINNIQYIHNNPIRAGMVQSNVEYAWSSACYYHGVNNSKIEGKIAIDIFGGTLLT